MERRDLVRLIVTALARQRDGIPCADGPGCVWCPAEEVADHLIVAGVVKVEVSRA